MTILYNVYMSEQYLRIVGIFLIYLAENDSSGQYLRWIVKVYIASVVGSWLGSTDQSISPRVVSDFLFRIEIAISYF